MSCLPVSEGCAGRACTHFTLPHASRYCVWTCARAPRSLSSSLKSKSFSRRQWQLSANTGRGAGRTLNSEPIAEPVSNVQEPKDDLWIHTGLVLLVGGLVPSLIGTHFLKEVCAVSCLQGMACSQKASIRALLLLL